MKAQITPEQMPARYAEYNLWANRVMAQWLATATPAQWEQEIASSFSSLRATTLHIWSAEYLWLQVLKGQSHQDNPARHFEGTAEDALAEWLKASEAFYEWVAAQGADGLAQSRESGNRPPLAVTDIIQHCMNHSTYHRGQLITLGRQAELSNPPRTDFIHFVGL
jgi:uncharacterized damage-inducible protein DinB